MRHLLIILIFIAVWMPGKAQDPVLLTKYFQDSAQTKNVLSVTIRESDGDSTIWGFYKLDTNGRIIEMEINGVKEILKYDKYGNRIFDPKSKRKYNSNGQIIWEQTPDLYFSTYQYDSLGKLTKEEFFLASGELNQYWKYVYNDEGYLSKIYAYDPPIMDKKHELGTTTTYQYGNWGMLLLYRFEYRMGRTNERKYSYENGLPVILKDYVYQLEYDVNGFEQVETILKNYDIIYEIRK